ncbi:hypothetical protein FIA58_013960 [Flavobacterium jejuense]|uniref:Uncharacterized protein n=1 Tax=Flavobacterium jejuense TaxID=1544455 RepID=A0ABX0IXP6_9FLAO|nr:hypothetical protein [Flavobacterium jejuense]NHN26786.1 hypothetical protein [Flavobacterium jejuense]
MRTINTLTVLVYIVYAIAIYFFIIVEDYKLSSIILMFAVFGLNISYTMFKQYLTAKLMQSNKDKEMTKMLNDYQKTKIPNCKCSDPQYCDIWCVGKAN